MASLLRKSEKFCFKYMHVVITQIVLSHHKIYKVKIHFYSHIYHILSKQTGRNHSTLLFSLWAFLGCNSLQKFDWYDGGARDTFIPPPPPPKKKFEMGGVFLVCPLPSQGKTRMGYFQWRVHRRSSGWNVSWRNGYSNFLFNFTHENRAKSLNWLLYQRLTEWIHVFIIID